MKKSTSTQELVNIYPPWARIRTDEQSVGYQLLNAVAKPMDEMSKSLKRMEANSFLITANLDEIDLVYRAELPVAFDFDEDTNDPAVVVPQAPTVSGLIDGAWYDVEPSQLNNIPSFWYESTPNRASLEDIVSGVDDNLIEFEVTGLVHSGLWTHHLDEGYLYLESDGEGNYLFIEEDQLKRARVAIFGETRQGLKDQETLIFPWSMRQRTQKEWRTIDRLELRDFPDGVTLRVKSGDFAQSDYLSPWNLRYSGQRRKIDEFWGLGTTVSGSTLDRIEYVTDEWQLLIRGMIEKDVRESWELLDSNYEPITGVDIALQPFSDNAWMVTSGGMLYCYDTEALMVSGVKNLRERTPGTHVQIDVEPRWLLLGEDIDFIPWYPRPLNLIRKYRIWYKTPSGTKYSLVDGLPTAFDPDLWVIGRQLDRTIDNLISITTTERGEYLLALDVIYDDEDSTEHNERVLVSVNYKRPKGAIDLSPLVPDEIVGIDFDADQRLWVKTADKYYKINLHTDIMLIDYQQKIIYFKEPYEQVVVDNNV